MNLGAKLYAALISGAVLALVLTGLFLWGQQGHKSAARAAQQVELIATQLDAEKRLTAALNKRARVADTQRAAAERRAKELADALQENREWADARVPDSVRNALGPTSGPGQPAGAPGKAGAAGPAQP